MVSAWGHQHLGVWGPCSRREEGSLPLPVEVQQAIDMESFRIRQTGSGGIDLRSGNRPLDPQEMGPDGVQDEVYEPLSEI